MRIGWLVDVPPYVGGAELNAQAFRDGAPEGVEIVDCPPGGMVPGCDLYIVQNCISYPVSVVPFFGNAPVIKMLHDVWPHGDPAFRAWILEKAKRLIMVSPKVKDWLPYPVKVADVRFVPSAVDVAKFRAANANSNGRSGCIWLGFIHAQKGPIAAAEWAAHNGKTIDLYGWGDMTQVVEPASYKGRLEPEDVAGVMARYETLVFLPMGYDPCPRIIFEAWLAGCEIVTNAKQGATWWMENEPEAIEDAPGRFWEAVLA